MKTSLHYDQFQWSPPAPASFSNVLLAERLKGTIKRDIQIHIVGPHISSTILLGLLEFA